MTRYRLDVLKDGRRWCDISVEDGRAEEIVRDLLGRLPTDAGYRADVFIETEARRIVEVTDQARVLAVSYARERVDFPHDNLNAVEVNA
jgi:hypothetical protein